MTYGYENQFLKFQKFPRSFFVECFGFSGGNKDAYSNVPPRWLLNSYFFLSALEWDASAHETGESSSARSSAAPSPILAAQAFSGRAGWCELSENGTKGRTAIFSSITSNSSADHTGSPISLKSTPMNPVLYSEVVCCSCMEPPHPFPWWSNMLASRFTTKTPYNYAESSPFRQKAHVCFCLSSPSCSVSLIN